MFENIVFWCEKGRSPPFLLMGFRFKALNPHSSSHEVLLTSGEKKSWSIGRAQSSEIAIDVPTVSRHHAELVFDGTRMVLLDAGSRHGTFVNGQRVIRQELIAGDQIEIGKAEYMIEKLDDTAVVPLPAGRADNRGIEPALPAATTPLETRDAEREDRAGLEQELRAEVTALQAALAAKNEEISELRDAVEKGKTENLRLEANTRDWSVSYENLLTQYDECLTSLAERDEELASSKRIRERYEGRFALLVERLEHLQDKVCNDWAPWIDEEELARRAPIEGLDPVERWLDDLETAVERTGEELAKIAPHWEKHGEKMWLVLEERCTSMRKDGDRAKQELRDAEGQLELLQDDLREIREQISEEVRRAQGLSRVGQEIEIPERFEKMVVARDHEIEVFKNVIVFLEEFEKQVVKFQKSRSYEYRRVSDKLEDMRNRLVGILEANHVKAFTIDEGTVLTPRHRKTVKVVSPEGWGGKKYAELRFQPGEVIQIVRKGYEIGSGDFATVLRKVEVVLRSEGED